MIPRLMASMVSGGVMRYWVGWYLFGFILVYVEPMVCRRIG